MIARRGRCHQVFYKSLMKNIYDYESDENEISFDNFKSTKLGLLEQIEFLQSKGGQIIRGQKNLIDDN